MNGQNQSNIKIGIAIRIMQKTNQHTGNIPESVVSKILKNNANHPHSIKRMMADKQVGEVQKIAE